MPQRTPRKGDQKQSDTQTGGTAPQPVGESVPALIKCAKTEIIYYKPEQDENVPKRSFTRWLYYRSQIVLGFLTFGVLVLYALQWWEYRSTRELENRAYVAAKEVQLVKDTLNPEANNIYVSCVNAGKTPGLKGNIVVQMERRDASPPDEAVINQPEGPQGRIIFSPQVEIFKGVGIMPVVHVETVPNLPASNSETGKTGPSAPGAIIPIPNPLTKPMLPGGDNRLWYIYGVISYEDIFGRTHRTKFCFQNAPLTALWGYCPTYNDSN